MHLPRFSGDDANDMQGHPRDDALSSSNDVDSDKGLGVAVVRVRDINGVTPLHEASKYGHLDVVTTTLLW